MYQWVSLLFCFSLTLSFFSEIVSEDCVPRRYNHDSAVCVCNATYCDYAQSLPDLSSSQYALYITSKDGLRLSLSVGNFNQDVNGADYSLSIDLNSTFQVIEGFGGAFTDAAGLNIANLSPEAQELLLDAYFSKRGLSYNLGRVPIAGTDFSYRRYTYNDAEGDEDLKTFSLSEEDYLYKIPFIKRAMQLSEGNVRLLAAAWTAPPWMKTNNDYSGKGSLKEEYYQNWADYIIRFMEEYERENMTFWIVSTQNEPTDGNVLDFPFNCMGWSSETQRTWISQFMGPTLARSRFNSTRLNAYDDQRLLLPSWLNKLYEGGDVAPYIGGIGVHWYDDYFTPPSLLDAAHEAHPDLFILSTESCVTRNRITGEAVHLGDWEIAGRYATSMIQDLNHWVAGWVDWNLALDELGGPNWSDNFVDAAIIVNKTSDEFYKQPFFYALAHFSKFLPLGSERVGLTESSLESVAFLTPDQRAVVILHNRESNEITVKINGTYHGFAHFTMPPRSIVTFITGNVFA